MPSIVILGGPNGAGKTTVSRAVLAETLGITEFVNADAIAAGLSGFAPETAAIRAGRLMLERLDELADSGVDFAFETTLASRTFAPWLRRQIGRGYGFRLIYIWLKSPDLAVRRVRARVAKGGHGVPGETVRRRYWRGLRNLRELYMPIAADWRIYDNSGADTPRLIARGNGTEDGTIKDQLGWRRFIEACDRAVAE